MLVPLSGENIATLKHIYASQAGGILKRVEYSNRSYHYYKSLDCKTVSLVRLPDADIEQYLSSLSRLGSVETGAPELSLVAAINHLRRASTARDGLKGTYIMLDDMVMYQSDVNTLRFVSGYTPPSAAIKAGETGVWDGQVLLRVPRQSHRTSPYAVVCRPVMSLHLRSSERRPNAHQFLKAFDDYHHGNESLRIFFDLEQQVYRWTAARIAHMVDLRVDWGQCSVAARPDMFANLVKATAHPKPKSCEVNGQSYLIFEQSEWQSTGHICQIHDNNAYRWMFEVMGLPSDTRQALVEDTEWKDLIIARKAWLDAQSGSRQWEEVSSEYTIKGGKYRFCFRQKCKVEFMR